MGEAVPPMRLGPFDGAALAFYAQASGDDNPLHLDPQAALSIGLPHPPVQGMLILSSFEPSLVAWRLDLRLIRLSAKFLRPVFAGDGLVLSGKVVRRREEPEPEILLRLMAHVTAPAGCTDPTSADAVARSGRSPNGSAELAVLAEAGLTWKKPHAS